MPEEGVKQVDHTCIMQEEEIVRICRVMAELGISRIKLTGGEPLVRKGIPTLTEKLKSIPGIEQVTLTTNGILLKEQMADFARAGLDGLNVSLDTRNPEVYHQITRRDDLQRTMEGIEEALKYPQISLKVNCVPLGFPGQNLSEVAELARDYPLHVRFIEMMPIGYGKIFRGMSEQEVLEILEKDFGTFVPYEGARLGNGPCHYYNVEGFRGKVGFISAISHKFCSSCNRIRLTSQGYLKTCLQYTTGRDLRQVLRNGSSDEEVKRVIQEALEEKPKGHAFLEKAKEDETEKLCMSQIGG
jgi:cyclic pyranopterin phosphate synthase